MNRDVFAPVARIDGPGLAQGVLDAGGPRLELVELLSGGEVGAWLVRWPDGHFAVMTWTPPTPEGLEVSLTSRLALMDLARDAGIPIPRIEAVVPVGDQGAAVLQERALGQLPQVVTADLIDRLLDLVDIRRHMLAGTAFVQHPVQLYLTRSGPGFCLHETLRAFSANTADMLERIKSAAVEKDQIDGDDLVHFDYHLGNVLIDPGQRDQVTAILDWDGAGSGSVAIDLAILVFDLSWRGLPPIENRVENRLIDLAGSSLPKVWAHVSLRLLDWSIRHHPEDLAHWLRVAERHLPK